MQYNQYLYADGIEPFSQDTLRQYDITPEDVHIDAPLSNVLLKYRPTGFIADRVLPIVPVAKQSDVIAKVDKAPFYRDPDGTERAPGTEPKMIHFTVTSDTYFAINYALGTYLTREELANADTAWNTRQLRGELIMDAMYVDYERRIASAATTTTNVGTYWTPGSLWSDRTNSNAFLDIFDALDVSEQLSGIRPNRLIFGRGAWHNWRLNDKVKAALVPYGGADVGMSQLVTVEQTKQLLEVEEVLIGGAYYSSAVEDASATLARIWGNHVVGYYAPARPSREVPSWGYSFRWNVPGMPNLTARTFPFDDKKGRQDMHVHLYQDEKILDTSLAFMVQSVA